MPTADPTQSAPPEGAPRLSTDTRLSRPLVPLALALVIGIALGELADLFPLGATALGVALWGLHRVAGRSLPRVLVFAPRQWLVLIAAVAYTLATPPPSPDPRLITADPVTVEAELDAPIHHMPEWASVTAGRLRIHTSQGDRALAGHIRLSGPSAVFDGLRYGDIVRVTAAFHPPRGFRNPGLFDYGEWLERQNVVAVGTLKASGISPIGHRSSPILDPIYLWRERIRAAALASLPEDTAPIFLAMVTGETGYLTAKLRDSFMASGTVHLLSISGSHLGLIAFVIFVGARWTILRLPERLLLRMTLRVTPSQVAAAVTLAPVTFYALLAGGQVATLRALLMIALYLLAVMLHRQDDLFNALALAALAILAWDPHALRDVSFQLSFLSVLCIALGMEWWKARLLANPDDRPPTWKTRLFSKITLLIVTSVAAGVGTAPLVAHHFNQVNWVGLVSNSVIIPLAGVLVVPLGLVSGVAAAIGDTPTLPLASLNAFALDLLLRTVESFAAWPFAILYVAAPPLAAVALGYMALAGLLDRRLTPWKRGLAGGALVFLVVPWLAGVPRWGSNASLDITFLDVGQGDGAIVRFPSGEVMVVDGGKRFHELDVGRTVVAPMLWNRGIRKINYLVASHPQLDHIGGLPFLAERFAIGQAWTNGRRADLWASQRLDELVASRRIPESIVASAEHPLWIGAARVWRLNPLASLPFAVPAKSISENDRSIVLRVEYGRASVLLTGDLGTPGERGLVDTEPSRDLLPSTVIKVPHHGSRGSLDPAFLRAVSPRVAVVSVGANNTYGHPTPEMLAAYKRLGAGVFRTDLDGAETLVTDGTRLDVFRYQDLTPQPVQWGNGMAATEWRNLRTVLGSPIPALSLDLSKTEPPL
ncbi:MAG: DNA internalization-related competence protein ComEC/Rec2 [Nitrospirae bacterium]|nr:DNA internalization-related competence protein ComEC/Rec2 [Nitrospirota bacterium]